MKLNSHLIYADVDVEMSAEEVFLLYIVFLTVLAAPCHHKRYLQEKYYHP